MHGLVAYEGDSDDDAHNKPSSLSTNDIKLKGRLDGAVERGPIAIASRKQDSIAGTVIRKPPRRALNTIRRSRSRSPLPEISAPASSSASSPPPPIASTSHPTSSTSSPPLHHTADELTHIRSLLRPLPIPHLSDYGVPPAVDGEVDPVLLSKLTQFHTLKHDPTTPRHFNDSLMANRAFRNPHLYAQLVDFVDVDERATNFPKEVWDPLDVREEWYAERMAEVQKKREEKQSASQTLGKRSRIDFASSSSNSNAAARNAKLSAHLGMERQNRFAPYGSNVNPKDGSSTDGRWG